MKTIFTVFAFLFASLINVNAETMNVNQIRIDDVPAHIIIKHDIEKAFNISIKSDDNVLSNLIKVIDNKNGEWIVKLNRPIEESEIKSFTDANIVINITTPNDDVEIIPGRNISLSSKSKK